MVIVLPFLSYVPPFADDSAAAWVRSMKVLANPDSSSSSVDQKTCTSLAKRFYNFYAAKDQKLLSLNVQSPNANCVIKDWEWADISAIRSTNVREYESSFTYNAQEYTITAQMDITIPNQMEAMFGILIILLVIFLVWIY